MKKMYIILTWIIVASLVIAGCIVTSIHSTKHLSRYYEEVWPDLTINAKQVDRLSQIFQLRDVLSINSNQNILTVNFSDDYLVNWQKVNMTVIVTYELNGEKVKFIKLKSNNNNLDILIFSMLLLTVVLTILGLFTTYTLLYVFKKEVPCDSEEK